MRNSRVRALKRWLVVAIGISGAGVPLLDVVLYHSHPPSRHPVHVEAAGTDCHAESCQLGQTLPTSAGAVKVETGVRLIGVALRREHGLSVTTPRSPALYFCPPCRAPPAVFA